MIKEKRYDEAITYAKLVDKYDSENNKNHWLSQSNYNFENYTEALNIALKGVKLNPEDNRFNSLLGNIHKKLEQYEKAISYYKLFLEKQPNDTLITYRTSQCYYNLMIH